MSIRVTAVITGDEEWYQYLKDISPEHSREIIVKSLTECAQLVSENAKREQIIRGGSGPPDPDRLTSRTGVLRDSISVNTNPLPEAIEVGTDKIYGRAHELGFSGTVRVKAHLRTISKVFGKKISPNKIQVKAHSRMMDLPPRPFLSPAVDATQDRFPDVFIKHWVGVIGRE